MSEAKGTVDEASQERALRMLERRLDNRALHSLGRVWTAVQGRRRRVLGRARKQDVLGALEDLAAPPQRLARALSSALSAGALESAEPLVDRLLLQLPSLPASEALSAVVAAEEALLMLGQRERAIELANVHSQALASSAAGVALGELLERPGDASLPGGRPNLLGLSQRVASAQVSAPELASLLGLKTLDWLRLPEIRLLFFSALVAKQPVRALRFLNGFLALHGLDCRLSIGPARSSASFLGQLTACSVPRQAAGPLVSIVLPVYNGAATLGYALESLLGQSHAAVEILIGDDASTDGTLDVMRKYAADSRVRLFRSERNQGAYNARNALIDRARGEFVTFHDADDWAIPFRVERQVACLQRTGVVACVTNHLRLRPDGTVVFFKDQRATRLSRVSLMLRRESFDAVGPFRSALIGADEELQARLQGRFGHASLARIAAPLAFSLWSAASATRTPGKEALEDGYRSPSRRAYSELVFRKYIVGDSIDDAAVDARLRETRNYAAPSAMLALT